MYRLGLYEQAGLSVFDEHWYAGHALPGYSLLFPPLASLLGMRVLAVVSVLASVALFERIVLGVYGEEACVRLGACLFAVAAVGDVWSGRLTFALGVALALACAYALARERLLVAALLAGLCAAASPVAGVLLALAGLSYALARRAPLVLLAVGAPVALVVVPLRALFPKAAMSRIRRRRSWRRWSWWARSCGRCRAVSATGCCGSGRSCICWRACCA